MKNITLIAIALFLVSITHAQKKYETFWDAVLKNDRETATQVFKKIKKSNNLEYLITNEILRVENGKIRPNTAFIPNFLKQDDYEYYLYALWKEIYIFNDYLTSGLNNTNRANVNALYEANPSNTIIKDALTYLKGILHRNLNDFPSFSKEMDKIPTIDQWQYCGVFENLNDSGLDRYYEPEDYPKNDMPFNAESNGLVNWYTNKRSTEGYEFFSNHSEYGAGVTYAQSFITSPKEQELILRIGCGSAFKIWLNDVLVIENREDVVNELDAHNVKLTMPKGVNRLLLKASEGGYNGYFIMSLLNPDGSHSNGLTYSSAYSDYNTSTLEQIQPQLIKNQFESYFEDKVKQHPNNFFYTYCLANTYLRNSRHKEAKQVLQPFLDKYPKSSIIKKFLIRIYSIEEDYASISKVKDNIELDDPDYYLPMILKMIDFKELSRMTLTEYTTFLEKLKKTIDNDLIHTSADFLFSIRKKDMIKVKQDLNKLIKQAEGSPRLILKYAPIYSNMFQDDDKTITLLEKLIKDHYSYSGILKLARFYDKKNKKKDVIALITKDFEQLKHDNAYLKGVVNQLHTYEKYDKSLEYIDLALENYPYSFVFMELKGDALLQLKKKKEALIWYEKSLKHNSSKSSLRKKIKDLKEEENIINTLDLEKPYDYIKKNRSKITKNNYGYNLLFDSSILELYNEGGGNARYTIMYEVTSESGVEYLKEYNLGLSGNYHIIKSEVVKKDKSIVPAEKSGSSFVFNDLEIGDVIYIAYEYSFSKTGRFYKSYSDSFMIGTYHPTVHSNVKLVIPDGIAIQHKMINGTTQPKVTNKDGYKIYEWVKTDHNVLEQVEDYMPKDVDVAEYLHVSTIKDWHEIAIWYSDLVKTTMKKSAVVDKVFKDLFPNGYKSLSEDERAKTIYNYIKSTFNYSHVSFRQSGFIPQKPAKTIDSGLGDCKDLSTLFVVLAKKAGLDANLVLILTADYGVNSLVLPSTDFNHCIAKVMLNGKPQFIELTDKYLPYKSLPLSLRKATALEIPLSRNATTKKSNLFTLDNVARDLATVRHKTKLKIAPESYTMKINTTYKGHVNSRYASVFSEPNHEVIKTSMFDMYKNRIEDDFTLDTIYNIQRLDNDKTIHFSSDLTVNKKLNKIGSTYILELPKLSKPYTKEVIDYDKRNYDIIYKNYENMDKYYMEYDIELDKTQRFTEIPENYTSSYKKHSYAISYNLVSPNRLKVTIEATPSLENISAKEYVAFKDFVIKSIEAENALIGFKNK